MRHLHIASSDKDDSNVLRTPNNARPQSPRFARDSRGRCVLAPSSLRA
jgi:hypothetical protein